MGVPINLMVLNRVGVVIGLPVDFGAQSICLMSETMFLLYFRVLHLCIKCKALPVPFEPLGSQAPSSAHFEAVTMYAYEYTRQNLNKIVLADIQNLKWELRNTSTKLRFSTWNCPQNEPKIGAASCLCYCCDYVQQFCPGDFPITRNVAILRVYRKFRPFVEMNYICNSCRDFNTCILNVVMQWLYMKLYLNFF